MTTPAVSAPVVSEMICSSTQYLTENSSNSVDYRPHRLFYNRGDQLLKWPIDTDEKLTCWHCIFEIDPQNAIPIPQSYDERTGKYTVKGVFCSFGCAKRYALEHYNSNTTILLMYLNQMAREVYSFFDPIKPAPPQSSLKRFGGPFTITEFRKFIESKSSQVELCEPPFVSNVMIYNAGFTDSSSQPEKSQAAMAASAAASVLVDENPQLKRPSLFENYLKKRTVETPTSNATVNETKQKKQKRGSLSVYFKTNN